MNLFFSAGILSIDSLVVSLAVSPLIHSPGQRWRLAGLFGLCDGLAVLAGFAWGKPGAGVLFGPSAAPIFAMACGAYLLAAAGWKKFQANPRTILFLPVLMSLDNFAYGVGMGPLTGSVGERAIILGLASFSLAMLGLFAGSFIGVPRRWAPEWSAGIALVGAGLMLLFV